MIAGNEGTLAGDECLNSVGQLFARVAERHPGTDRASAPGRAQRQPEHRVVRDVEPRAPRIHAATLHLSLVTR